MNELGEIIAWVRAHGPVSLPLKGWDQASIWGWDHSTSSLYAHLRRNTDNPDGPPAIRIEPDVYTPAITLLPTLAQYIAMAVNRSLWFAEPTNRKLRRSAHHSVTQLEADIRAWTDEWNTNPKPLVWTKGADEILDSLAACCRRINDSETLVVNSHGNSPILQCSSASDLGTRSG